MKKFSKKCTKRDFFTLGMIEKKKAQINVKTRIDERASALELVSRRMLKLAIDKKWVNFFTNRKFWN